MTETDQLKRIQELELELNKKQEELEANGVAYEKLKEDNHTLRTWNQELYSKLPVATKEEKAAEPQKITAEDIKGLWTK